MHPSQVIELMMVAGIVITAFIIVWFIPKRWRRVGLLIATCITLAILAFFFIRPLWYDHQAEKSTEKLSQYLMLKYPEEDWEIDRVQNHSYNPYQLNVTFEDEKGWVYTYFVKDKICQLGWTVPGHQLPREGKYYDVAEHCEE